MIDEREIVRVAVERLAPPEPSYERLVRRRDRKRRNQRIAAGVVGIAVFVAAVWIVTSVGSLDRTETPAVPGQDRTGGAPPAGRVRRRLTWSIERRMWHHLRPGSNRAKRHGGWNSRTLERIGSGCGSRSIVSAPGHRWLLRAQYQPGFFSDGDRVPVLRGHQPGKRHR